MVSFASSNPQQLLASLKAAVAIGEIETWANVNGYFTHTPPQWNRKAFFLPSIAGQQLNFSIICPRGGNVSSEIYAVYHGRFIEMMLAHFDQQFSDSAATALASTSDKIAA